MPFELIALPVLACLLLGFVRGLRATAAPTDAPSDQRP